MPEVKRAGELDFPSARDQVEKEIEEFLKSAGQSVLELPSLQLEKGETRFSFSPAALDRGMILDALALIKNHIENLRIHTFDSGYVIFQSMDGNLYDSKSIAYGTKFKFQSIGQQPRIDVTRKGDFDQNEIQACLNLFKLFHPSQKESDPGARLAGLGITVYEAPPKTADGGNSADRKRLSWDSISGYKTTKREVQESIVLPLRQPDIFLGVAKLTRGEGAPSNMPRAVLFDGPPGVGKTTMARIIATEARIPLIYVPIENILSKFYGESSQNMAAIFDAAGQFDRAILFLDEIDSLAGRREDGMFEATRRVLSVLLRKIDGFESKPGVLTVGATNRSVDLDQALLSRFDLTIHFPLPDLSERAAIFGQYAKHLKQEDLMDIAGEVDGLSGRNIQDLCEYAERRWARQLIKKGAQVSAPPAVLYKDITRNRTVVQA